VEVILMINIAGLFQQYSDTPLYNTKLVVSKTGVPADTFRAWERRYGVPQPQRAEGGQRLYSERDIALIRWLRDRTSEGLTISQAVALLKAKETTPPATTQPRSFAVLRNDLLHALLHFNARAADSVLSEAFALHPLDAVYMNIIQPVLIDVGELWHAGKASVAQEHFASHFLRRKLLALLNIYDVSEGRATIIAACAPGEQHELGLLLLALLLVRRNYRVIFLGADVPLDALQQTVAQVQPDVVCISASTPVTAEHALTSARALRVSAPNTLVVVGGQGLDIQEQDLDGIFYLHDNGVAAVEQIEVLLASKLR
jgi:DNA-binding transcriptional MerR regulator